MTLAATFKRIYYSLFLLVCISHTSFGQSLAFRNYSVDQGLPFVQVFTIFQDSKGYLWSGGYGGLSRFDGFTFTNFSPQNGLPNHWVTSITEDQGGNLWIGTIEGLSRLTNGVFSTYTIKDGLPSNYVNCVMRDGNNVLWVGTDKGLAKSEGASFSSVTIDPSQKDLSVLCLYEEPLTGKIWIGTSNGIYLHTKNKIQKINFPQLYDDDIHAINRDAVEKMKEYDEEVLLKKFRKEAFINNFSIAKGRLYETILRSLDVFHHNSSVDAQLWKELHYAEILYKKTLYEQCAKRLKSARRLAEKYEKHAVLVQIHALEKSLAEKDGYAGMSDEDILAILKEDNAVADHIRTYNDLWNVKSRLFLMLNTKGRARGSEQLEQFRQLIDASLGDKKPEGLTATSRFMYHHTYSAYYFAISDAENCYHHLAANVELIESNTDIFRDEPNVYFGVLTNLIYVCSRLKRYNEVLSNLKKLRVLPEKLDTARNEDLEVKLFASAYSLELTLYNSLGKFDRAVALVPKIAEGLEQFEGSISKIREAHFCMSCAVACYGAGKLQQSLRWTSRLLNDTAVGKNEWIFAVAQVFSLILHIELNHKDTLPYVARNVQRYLKTRNRSYQFEHEFLKFAEKVGKAEDTDDIHPLYRDLSDKLNVLDKDPFEKSAFEYFDFPAWAEAKCSGRSFRDIAEEKSGAEDI